MDNTKLIKAREFYELTQDGMPKNKAAKQVGMSLKSIENSSEYSAIVAIGSAIERDKLKQEIEQVKRKQIKSYSTLLDKGEELMNDASTLEEKVLAQQNQRANLQTGVVESAVAWDGEDRNQDDLGGVMEAVIV